MSRHRVEVRIRPASGEDVPALVGILAIAGEHLHRVQGRSHWYPFPLTERYLERMEGREPYAVEVDDLLVGTFDLSIRPERYHQMDRWPDGDVLAMYFGGFAILPSHWGRGIGTRVMATVDEIARTSGHRLLRFDAVSSNEILIDWYRSLGYVVTGAIDLGTVAVTCFEKRL